MIIEPPCDHPLPPESAATLDGVCLYCYRERLRSSRADALACREELERQYRLVEVLEDRVETLEESVTKMVTSFEIHVASMGIALEPLGSFEQQQPEPEQ